MKNFTLSDLEKLKEQGKIKGFTHPGETKKKSKYGNKKVEFEGMVFDSKKEYNRFLELRYLKQAGEIGYLERQMPFELKVGDGKICTYIADFVYERDGKMVVEDVKSGFTRRMAVYRLKKKLMKEILGIEIEEV